MALTDALGNLIDFRLLPGQAHDLRGTAALIERLSGGKLLADRAFDANWLREVLARDPQIATQAVTVANLAILTVVVITGLFILLKHQVLGFELLTSGSLEAWGQLSRTELQTVELVVAQNWRRIASEVGRLRSVELGEAA